jgi:mannose/fructose-specific phosphotransferase system component IIA
VQDKLQEIGDFDQLIVFCDLHGGSVQQELFRQTQQDSRNIQLISGYNLPLVMDIMFKGRILSDDEIRESIRESREAIVYLKDFCVDDTEDDLF